VDNSIALKRKKMNCKNIKEKVGIRSVLESLNHFPVKENKKTAFTLRWTGKKKSQVFP
jgi:hypothetical protein